MNPEFNPSQVGRAQLDQGDIMAQTHRWRWFIGWCAVLAGVFGKWLLDWARFAMQDELASYVLLIPAISAYLVWQRRREAIGALKTSLVPGLGALAVGAGFAILALRIGNASTEAGRSDCVSAAMASFLSCAVGVGFLLLGKSVLKQHGFAITFLLFAIPIPVFGINALEVFFQHTSAEVAATMIEWAGIPILRNGLVFQLPGIALEVAQECSGIRSSIVLFITSILTAHLFLKNPWRQAALAAFVIPLAIIRNGLRILTIATLCVHVSPDMIDSPIHHRGGPLFFALSLIPFFVWLIVLRRGETAAAQQRTMKDTN